MIKELIFFIFLFSYFGCIGLGPCYWLLGHRRAWWLLPPLLGVGIASLVNTILWVQGATIEFNFWLIFGLGILSSIFYAFRRHHTQSSPDPLRSRLWSVYLLGSILLLATSVTHGPRFSFFQGNIWDTFGYWEAAQIYAQEKFDTIKNFTPEDIEKIPARQSAVKDLYARPGVHALYALVTRALPAWTYRLHPIFLAYLLSLTILVFLFWGVNFSKWGVHKSFNVIDLTLLALPFATGFWGQYIFDINSWGNMSSLALMLLVCWLVTDSLDHPTRSGKIYVLLTLCLASIFYLYPEISVFYAPAIIFMVLINTYSYKKIDWFFVRGSILSLSVGLLLSTFHWQGTFGFVIHQIQFGTTEQHGMWTYFQKFFFGHGDISLLLKQKAEEILVSVQAAEKTYAVGKVDWISFIFKFFSGEGGLGLALQFINNLWLGFLGLYWLSLPPGVDERWQLFISIFTSIFLATFLYFLLKKNKEKSYQPVVYLMLGLVLTISFFIFKKQFWSAGKALSFAMPMFFFLIWAKSQLSEHRGLKIAFSTFLVLQLLWALYRPISVNEFGIHYPYPPYPSIQKHVLDLKMNNYLGVETLIEKITSQPGPVLIEITHPWIARYLEAALMASHIEFQEGFSTVNINATPMKKDVANRDSFQYVVGHDENGDLQSFSFSTL